MKNYFYILISILLSGCALSPPSWDCPEREAVLKRCQNEFTQIEMNVNSHTLAEIAKNRMFLALEYKLSTLSYHSERLELIKEQAAWQRWVEQDNDELLCDGNLWELYRNERAQERYFQRFLVLIAPDKLYKIYKTINQLSVKFNKRHCDISFGEISEYANPHEDCIYCQRLQQITKNSILSYTVKCQIAHYKDLARVNFQFIRSINDYIIAIIEPTNYGIITSYGEKQQVNLCIWKDGINIANYLLGNEITVKSMDIDGFRVKINFTDSNELKYYREFDCRVMNDDSATVAFESLF